VILEAAVRGISASKINGFGMPAGKVLLERPWRLMRWSAAE
jgi:hypothetical protein